MLGIVAIHRVHRGVREKRGECEVILRSDGVELVIVTGGTRHGQAEPDAGGGLDPVHLIDRIIFLIDRATLASRRQAAVESTGHHLFERGVGNHIASELFDAELVEGHVLFESGNHPIAIRPNRAVIVDVDAVGIGVARGVEPVAGHLLGVRGGLEHAGNSLFVCVGAGVFEKCADVFRRRR